MGLYRSSSHVYWRCKYHIVWTPKYRFRILKDKLGKELYRTIYILCGIKDCEVLELNIQPDHVHLVVIVPPKISISTLMGHLKGRSAIRLYNRFPHIRKKLWGNHFWSLVSDPLGLQGGEQTYRYVPNPCGYIDPLGLAFCPRMQKALQKLTDKAIADIINNPKLAKDLMSAGSYAHLKNATELYAASFGKAVERRMAELVKENPKLAALVEHTGMSRGENGRFISSPDFTTKEHGVFDVTTNKALQAHIDRYTTAGVYTPQNDVGYLVYDVVYGLHF